MTKHATLPNDPIPAPDSTAINHATLELLAQWRAEDATDDPAEIEAAEKEISEFKKAMNENRTASGAVRLLFP